MAQAREDGSSNSEWGGGGVAVEREVVHSFKYLLSAPRFSFFLLLNLYP